MEIKRFEAPGLAQYSYMVSSADQAIVIDPTADVDRYLTYAEQQGLRIIHVVETHIHADFVSGAATLAAIAGATLALSAYDQDEAHVYCRPHIALSDGDSLHIGDAVLSCIHTPGHTPEHVCFLAHELSPEAGSAKILFSGDFLFAGSIGRPDLLGEANNERLALLLYQSLRETFSSLPDDVRILPGHGAGSLCGAGMRNATESTIGYERKTQPLLRLGEREFVRRVFDNLPRIPIYYARMKKVNAAGASICGVPGGTPLSIDEVISHSRRSESVLLDVRNSDLYAEAHIASAINIASGPGLALWAGSLLDADTDIVLITDGQDDEETRRALLRIGFDRISGFLSGGMHAWVDGGLDIKTTPQLSPKDMRAVASNALILDVRNDTEWSAGHIPEAHNVPLHLLPEQLNVLDRAQQIVAVCMSGYRSSIALSILEKDGFTNVSGLRGGMVAWNADQIVHTMSD